MKITELTAIGELGSNLPMPIKTGFFKALSALLGSLTAIPAAWAKRPAQAIDDVTAGRSAVAAALAKQVAENAVADPEIVQAALEIYLPEAVRKARNRAEVAQRTVAYVDQATSPSTPTDDSPNAPKDDWLNAFCRYCDDASSEQLQDLLARILSGEIVRPGSFSVATLRTIAELDQASALDFNLMWSRSVGDSVDYSSEMRRGDWFSRWKRLAEIGLMSATDVVQHLPPYYPSAGSYSRWNPVSTAGTFLSIQVSENSPARWQHIEFTRTGREIGSILAPPDYRANMRAMGSRLVFPGIVRVDLFSVGHPMENLFSS